MTTQPKISQNKQRKMEAVESLKVKLQKAKTFFLTDYRGLTHKQLETLRKSLKKVEAEYLVTKNRLLKLALDQIEVNVQSFKEA
ncbi:50S ribosomal protein L10, partial [Candidatus Gottesmanbacteria bacterium RIFCSPLOWO2_01_FULL_39_12b]